MAQDRVRGRRPGDEGDEPHLGPALGPLQRDDFIDAGQQLRPEDARGRALGVLRGMAVEQVDKSLKATGGNGVAAELLSRMPKNAAPCSAGNTTPFGSTRRCCCFDWQLSILIRLWTFTCRSEKLSDM